MTNFTVHDRRGKRIGSVETRQQAIDMVTENPYSYFRPAGISIIQAALIGRQNKLRKQNGEPKQPEIPPIPKKNIFQSILSVSQALLFGEGVSVERREARLAICAECDLVKRKANGTYKCSICSCGVTGGNGLLNLARYEETEKYGCRYPKGSKWKAAGV